MQVDPERLRQHYRSLSDEELSALKRDELTEMAQECYDAEWERRGRVETQESELVDGGDDYEDSSVDGEAETDWFQDAACVASFVGQPDGSATSDADEARLALQRAGVPCQISTVEVARSSGGQPAQHEYRAMVPAPFTLKAASILDKEIFNPQIEADWRIHLESLTNAELAALSPDVICAGLFDRIARLKKSYNDEVSRRFRHSSLER